VVGQGGDGVQGKDAKEQMAKERCKALEAKSAGTQQEVVATHRHRHSSARKLLQEGRAPKTGKRRWRSKLASGKARKKIPAHAANPREEGSPTPQFPSSPLRRISAGQISN
jgi:hypothetical protein